MNYYMKQKVFALKDKFYIYDENQEPVYYLEGKMISITGKHSLYDMDGNQVALISKKIISLMPKFFIELPNGKEYELRGKLAFAHEVYVIDELNWKLTGKFLQHDYTIAENGEEIAGVHHKWISWGDTYEISVKDGTDPTLVIAIILCIDMQHAESAAMSQTDADNRS